MARIATIQSLHPAATAAIKAVMHQFCAELVHQIEYPQGPQLQFALLPGTDLHALDSALDRSEAANGYRGRITD